MRAVRATVLFATLMLGFAGMLRCVPITPKGTQCPTAKGKGFVQCRCAEKKAGQSFVFQEPAVEEPSCLAVPPCPLLATSAKRDAGPAERCLAEPSEVALPPPNVA